MLKRKKTITDIAIFTLEKDVKDDPLAWNCFNANKYSKSQKTNLNVCLL